MRAVLNPNPLKARLLPDEPPPSPPRPLARRLTLARVAVALLVVTVSISATTMMVSWHVMGPVAPPHVAELATRKLNGAIMPVRLMEQEIGGRKEWDPGEKDEPEAEEEEDEEDDWEGDDWEGDDHGEKVGDQVAVFKDDTDAGTAQRSGLIGDGVTHDTLRKEGDETKPMHLEPAPTTTSKSIHKRRYQRGHRRHSQSRRKRSTKSRRMPRRLPRVDLFPANAPIHNKSFIMQSSAFDAEVARDKGIILCLHDKTLALGLSLIKELRCLGNHELIQVYHCLPADLSLANRQLLTNQDDRLEVIDVCSDLVNAKVWTAMKAKRFRSSSWIKPLAIHHTDLQEPILLDASDILLQNPAVLRDTNGYQANGTLFFYDRVLPTTSESTARFQSRTQPQSLDFLIQTIDYKAFGLTGRNATSSSHHLLASFLYRRMSTSEMDFSVAAIDKTRAGPAMEMLWYILTKLRHQKAVFPWDDHESLWLAFELAQQPYAFSPWGASAVESDANSDMETHPETLCGSIAQYVPVQSEPALLLYVKGSALLDPLTQGIHNHHAKPHELYNADVRYVAPRMPRAPLNASTLAESYPPECLVGMGATPLPKSFQQNLFRRRIHYMAIVSGLLEPLDVCEFEWVLERNETDTH